MLNARWNPAKLDFTRLKATLQLVLNSNVRRDLTLRCWDKYKKPKYASQSPFKNQLGKGMDKNFVQKISILSVESIFPLPLKKTKQNKNEWLVNRGMFYWLLISLLLCEHTFIFITVYYPIGFYTAINLFLVL